MKLSKTILAVVGATMLLGALVSSASAGRLSTSAQTTSATWSRMTFTGPFGTTACEVTLGGSLHTRTIAKVRGALIGFIHRVTIRLPCPRGEMTFLREALPWHVQYDSFSGTLPNITGIHTRIIGMSFQINEGLICLARSTAAQPATRTLNREAGSRIISDSFGGSISTTCGIAGTLGGTSSSIQPLTVTLI
jgi:hypothetical protein